MVEGLEIVSVREDQSLGQNNQIVQAIIVEYRVGKDGPFREVVPKAEFSEARVMEAIEKLAADIGKLREVGASS